MKQCLFCNKKFISSNSLRKYCSEECYRNNQKKYEKLDQRILYRKNYKKTDKYKQKAKEYRKTLKSKQYQKQYRKSDKSISYQKKYERSDKRKKYKKDYEQRDERKQYRKNYEKTTSCKLAHKKWQRSALGKYSRLRCHLKRMEREKNCIHSFSKEEWRLKCEATKGICSCCYYPFNNGRYKLSLDHNPSLVKANKNFKLTGIKQIYTINEVAPLCLRCNITKGDKDITLEELRNIVLT